MLKRFFLVTLMVLMAVPTFPSYAQEDDECDLSEDYADVIAEGIELYDEEEDEDAFLAFECAAQINPDDYEAQSWLGYLALEAGEVELAASFYARAIELGTPYTDDYYNAGSIVAEAGDLATAVEVIEAGMALDDTTEGYSWLGYAYLVNGDSAKALENYNITIEAGDAYAEDFVDRATIYIDQENYEAALADLETAIELDNGYGDAYAWRGYLYLLAEEYEIAIADYNTAIELESLDVATFLERAYVNLHLDEVEDALNDITTAIEIAPDYSALYSLRGQILLEMEEYEAAIEDLTHALELDPNDYWALLYRAEAYFYNEDDDLAVEDLASLVTLAETTGDVYVQADILVLQAELAYYDDDSATAFTYLEQALELDPENQWAYSLAGEISIDEEDYATAILALTQAIELNPEDAWSYLLRGYAYENSGDEAKAESDYDKALELDPTLEAYMDEEEASLGNVFAKPSHQSDYTPFRTRTVGYTTRDTLYYSTYSIYSYRSVERGAYVGRRRTYSN